MPVDGTKVEISSERYLAAFAYSRQDVGVAAMQVARCFGLKDRRNVAIC
jgi:hypothetical protein